MRASGLVAVSLILGGIVTGCTSDPPGYPRYGLSDEPDSYAEPMNYAHGADYRRWDQDTRRPGDGEYYLHCYPDGRCERVH